jgi:hypothetical protein
MGNARRGQRLPETFEGVDEILREREPHRWIGPYEFFFLRKVKTTVWGSAQYLGPVVESVLPEGAQLLQDECGLGRLLSVQWAPVLVRLDGDPCGEAGRNLVP